MVENNASWDLTELGLDTKMFVLGKADVSRLELQLGGIIM